MFWLPIIFFLCPEKKNNFLCFLSNAYLLKIVKSQYESWLISEKSLGVEEGSEGGQGVQSLDNLCGDLNKGYIPKSPLGRNVNGHSYPLWELSQTWPVHLLFTVSFLYSTPLAHVLFMSSIVTWSETKHWISSAPLCLFWRRIRICPKWPSTRTLTLSATAAPIHSNAYYFYFLNVYSCKLTWTF